MEDNFKPKSFWNKPEGTAGMIVIAGAAVGLLFVGPWLLAALGTLFAVLGQAVAIGVLCGAVFLAYLIISNGMFQALVRNVFKSSMRALAGAFVELDPIGVMKNYISDLRKKREEMQKSISALNGQIQICEQQVNQNQAEYDKAMRMYKVASEKGAEYNNIARVESRKAGRRDSLNKEKLIPLLNKMKSLLMLLRKYYEVTGSVIDDMTDDIQVKEMERNSIRAAYKSMSMAKKILSDGGSDKEMFDMALEKQAEDYGKKLGDIEEFLETSKGFVQGLDLQNGVYDAEAQSRLAVWLTKADSILGTDTKQAIIHDTTPGYTFETAPASSKATVDYAQLLSRK